MSDGHSITRENNACKCCTLARFQQVFVGAGADLHGGVSPPFDARFLRHLHPDLPGVWHPSRRTHRVSPRQRSWLAVDDGAYSTPVLAAALAGPLLARVASLAPAAQSAFRPSRAELEATVRPENGPGGVD